MLYYKITVLLNTDPDTEKENPKNSGHEYSARLAEKIFLAAADKNTDSSEHYLFMAALSGNEILFGLITHTVPDRQQFADCMKTLDLDCKNIKIKEITFQSIYNLLSRAGRQKYIEDYYEVLENYHLQDLRDWSSYFSETVLKPLTKETALSEKAGEIISSSLESELARIYASEKEPHISGHPVHYVIKADTHEAQQKLLHPLLQALYNRRRLQGLRYATIDLKNNILSRTRAVYAGGIGATVVLEYRDNEENESEFLQNSMYDIQTAMEIMKKYQHEVLTMICLPRACTRICDRLLDYAGNCVFISLEEDILSGSRVRQYLQQLADSRSLEPDDALFHKIDDDQKGFLPTELETIFESWRNVQLRTRVYPQYADFQSADIQAAKKEPSGSTYQKLQKMIGLKQAKRMIDKSLNYYKAQKLFKDLGVQSGHPSMHMVFTGNPGTAKTTTARLLAAIMKENGLLAQGKLYELGRSDLVGKYVGWTASIVKEKFQKAKGSILFIDEAYSLLDGHTGLYGDEAINTIVQEMENCREDTVVIFAGYPVEMEQFLSRNPGLRSRIAFHISFDDYTAEELYQITQLIVEEKGMLLSEGVREKLLPIFEAATERPDFGNGRFARNLVEKALMNQADRLIQRNPEMLTRKEATLLKAEDFEKPEERKCQKTTIGFAINLEAS